MQKALDLDSVRGKILEAVSLRKKYTPCGGSDLDPKISWPGFPSTKNVHYAWRKGLLCFKHNDKAIITCRESIDEFYKDMATLFEVRTDGAVGTFAFHRLRLLATKWELFTMMNFDIEAEEMRDNPHRDFFNVRKVDTHIHHSASMNAKHLLRFIKKKHKRSGNDVVMTKDGKPVNLQELFKSLDIKFEDLSLDMLNVVADQTVFHRFDRFNAKYSPMDKSELRTVFLKTDNEMGGKYLAELTKEMLDDLAESKYQHTEWRLSIYGRNRGEWLKLSKWVLNHNLLHPMNRWMIQIPRLYNIYKSSKQINTFEDMLENIFGPMIEATLDPVAHPEIAKFLEGISGFDSVDDESKSEVPKERKQSSRYVSPDKWDIADNPSYKYYNFYLQTNLRLLNKLRKARGMHTLQYRPHAGEAGELHHLDTAFLLADSINHGIELRRSMPLQYLFYLEQIGLAVSPCSNNHLFLTYQKSPFLEFFQRGLNVSLSTDDPLMFHQTKEPLMEEYSIAKQFFKLHSPDLCELARNSVMQSGFSHDTKVKWLGENFHQVNNILKTNVPHVRFNHRRAVLQSEKDLLESADSQDEVMKLFRKSVSNLNPLSPGSPVARQSRALRKTATPLAGPSVTQSSLEVYSEILGQEMLLPEAMQDGGLIGHELLEPTLRQEMGGPTLALSKEEQRIRGLSAGLIEGEQSMCGIDRGREVDATVQTAMCTGVALGLGLASVIVVLSNRRK